MNNKYLTENEVCNRSNWDEETIKKFLVPIKLQHDIKYYYVEDIKAIERSSSFIAFTIKKNLKNRISKERKNQLNNEIRKIKIIIYNFNKHQIKKKALKYIRKKTNIKGPNDNIIKNFCINTIRHKYSNYDEIINKISERRDLSATEKNYMVKILKKISIKKIKRLI